MLATCGILQISRDNPFYMFAVRGLVATETEVP